MQMRGFGAASFVFANTQKHRGSHTNTHTRELAWRRRFLYTFFKQTFSKSTQKGRKARSPLDRYFRFQFESVATTVPLAMQKQSETSRDGRQQLEQPPNVIDLSE